VLHILLRVIEAHLRRSSAASSQARLKAVSFIHRFGASLNRHVHYHCCIIDGVFEPVEEAGDGPQSVRFRAAAELTPEAVAAIAEQVRVRVLRWFARSGLIERDDVREMLTWENSGFSLDAAVRVGAHDRAGLERLLRYCARPPFALERLRRSRPRAARPPGTRHPSRCRTGISSNSPTRTSSSISALCGSRRLSQGTVQPLSSAGVTLPRRCTRQHLGPRAPAPLRRPSAPQLGVDSPPHPRKLPSAGQPGRSGWLGFPIRKRGLYPEPAYGTP
jgi:hypothetical protein